MGKAKCGKQLDLNYGKGFEKKSKFVVKLGKFMDSDQVTRPSRNELEQAGIKVTERCIPFVVEDFNIGGLAYPSLGVSGKKAKVCVEIFFLPSKKCTLSKSEAEKKAILVTPKIRSLVAKAYKNDMSEVVASLW
jgi:hypothetical protein